MSKTINISFVGDDGQIWYADGYVDYQLKEKDKEIERLKENNENMQIEMASCWEKIDKAIEYLTDEGVCILNKGMKENEQLVWTWENYYDLLDILKGEDKE